MSQTNPDIRTMHDLVRNALQVQDAGNMSGIIHSFSRDIARLRILTEGEPGFSTEKLNRHPVCVLYSTQIAFLTGSETGLRYSRAYNWCKEVVAQDPQRFTLPDLPVDAN